MGLIREKKSAVDFVEIDGKIRYCPVDKVGKTGGTSPTVTYKHLEDALIKCKRTVSLLDIDRINKFTEEFGSSGN